jgi:hypothetical protein
MSITPERCAWAAVAVAAALAVAGANPYAGGWNDGSRLASVESLVSRGCLPIDDSVFVHPEGVKPPPYGDPSAAGTCDRLLIGGHFYSDKPAVISLLMAGVYRAGMLVGLPSPTERPDIFCWVLTVLFAGGSLVVALLCMWGVGKAVGLEGWALTAWLASIAFATPALAYTRHVNNHILHLAVLAGVCLIAVRPATAWRMIALGTLAGVGFNLDLGSGPLLLLACLALAWRPGNVLILGLAALPWVAAGMGINYAIGGTLKPFNMVAEYSRWPGSPFDETTLTGFWRHSPTGLATYSLGMLFGKKGLVTHAVPLWLCLPACVAWAWRWAWRYPLLVLLGWCGASWMLYSALSNNWAGVCLSIRWFLPFLAPLYLFLALYLKDRPERLGPFLALSAVGAVMGVLMFAGGPWPFRMVPLLWPLNGLALACGLAAAWPQREREKMPVPSLLAA